jgi:calcineurin-like phosphoesterase family protein
MKKLFVLIVENIFTRIIMIWFTADTHFDHPWMAKERGFHCTSYHDNALIKAWNRNVKRGDCVVVCGDVFWTDFPHVTAIWKMLHGTKILVKGNHDHRWLKTNPGQQYEKIYEHNYKLKGGKAKQHVVACHYPMRSWNKKAHGAIHVHGHSHGAILLNYRNRKEI